MVQKLVGVSITMLGGDLRELELAKTLLRYEADLRLVGFPLDPAIEEAKHYSDPKAAVKDAKIILAPMSNTDMEGHIVNRLDDRESIDLAEVMLSLPLNTPILIGVAKPIIKQLAEQYRLRLIETAEIDEIAILNSIPTAEGAIHLAMQELPITLHGSRCLVVGFGRCGITLARALLGLGAQVTVAARSKAQLARAIEMGLQILPMESLCTHLETDVIFNTIPAVVLTRPYLKQLKPSTLIIDLAAAPGGVDFDAAKEYGIKAILALSLPGKVAPVTAGKILSQCIPRLLQDLLGGGDNAASR